ncbi:MAG: DUF1080 domain-containing protein [Planctomycetaceae bacterium]|nr:DUF1080 domain-containing protein [Planctomycetaceae bacterium]
MRRQPENRIRLLVLAIIITSTLGIRGQIAAEEHATYTSAEKADADFAYQGEYTGELTTPDGNSLKVGLQVIALGKGNFRAIAYHGGLPGGGWKRDADANPSSVEGTLKDGTVKFSGERGIGILSKDGIEISTPDGTKLGKLSKTERKSPTLGAEAPAGAIVLFDGMNSAAFENGRTTEDKLLMQGVTSKQKFGDCTLHLEFLLPYKPTARGQERGNSGCYLQGRYEVQILDSFGLSGEDNECGAIYGVRKPLVNMCLPPLTWQTYDIDFTAARYGTDGKKTSSAKLTVKHNGVLIHENVEVPDSTRAAPVKEADEPGPLYLQDHGNPVRFRNIWLIEKN